MLSPRRPAKLLSVLPHDRGSRIESNADSVAEEAL
jgi:hypothetical protein